MTSSFDLDGYFQRIGFTGRPTATLGTLRTLLICHTETIPFENLNPLLGWPVLLDAASLQEKLVRSRRGGYCYEQNLLLMSALKTLGFDVRGLAARVLWNAPEGVVVPRTHMLLRVDLHGLVYIADAGFGGLTLTGPLQLETGIEQSTPHELFRLMKPAGEFVLQAQIKGHWKPLYCFTLEAQLLPDYEMANWYVSRHPQSRFVNGLMAARTDRDRRYALLNNEFSVYPLNGDDERRVLSSGAEIREVLEGPIGVSMPQSPELDAVLSRLVRN